MSDETIFTLVIIEPNFKQVQTQFRNDPIFKKQEPEFTRKYKELKKKLSVNLTEIYWRSARSTAPIRSGTLREFGIENNISKITPSKPEGKVWISAEAHQPTYDFSDSMSYVGLFDLLSDPDNDFKRTWRYTHPIYSKPDDGYNPAQSVYTRDWLKDTNNQYRKRSKSFINSANGSLDGFLRIR